MFALDLGDKVPFMWERCTANLRVAFAGEEQAPPDDHEFSPLTLRVVSDKSLLYSEKKRQWTWHKKWTLPRFSVELHSAGSLLTGSAGLTVHVTAVVFNEAEDRLDEVGLSGKTSAPYVGGMCSFQSLFFKSTSFNNKGASFHLLIGVVHRADAPNAPRRLLGCWTSSPIHVDARKRQLSESSGGGGGAAQSAAWAQSAAFVASRLGSSFKFEDESALFGAGAPLGAQQAVQQSVPALISTNALLGQSHLCGSSYLSGGGLGGAGSGGASSYACALASPFGAQQAASAPQQRQAPAPAAGRGGFGAYSERCPLAQTQEAQAQAPACESVHAAGCAAHAAAAVSGGGGIRGGGAFAGETAGADKAGACPPLDCLQSAGGPAFRAVGGSGWGSNCAGPLDTCRPPAAEAPAPALDSSGCRAAVCSADGEHVSAQGALGGRAGAAQREQVGAAGHADAAQDCDVCTERHLRGEARWQQLLDLVHESVLQLLWVPAAPVGTQSQQAQGQPPQLPASPSFNASPAAEAPRPAARLEVVDVLTSSAHGYSRAELRGGDFLQMVHPSERMLLKGMLLQLGSENSALRLQMRVVSKANDTVSVDGTLRLDHEASAAAGRQLLLLSTQRTPSWSTSSGFHVDFIT